MNYWLRQTTTALKGLSQAFTLRWGQRKILNPDAIVFMSIRIRRQGS